jgi:hypothetical protein
MYLLVKHPKKASEYAIVKGVASEFDTYKADAIVKVYVGQLPSDVPPAGVLKVKPKTAGFTEPGLYWRQIVSTHGKKTSQNVV